MEESASDDIFDLKLRGPMYEENDMATRFVLCGIESQHQTCEIYSDFWSRNKSGVYMWTIEHIFPEGQNVPDEWVKMIADGDKVLANNYRETYVHTLGNLELLVSSTLALDEMVTEKIRELAPDVIVADSVAYWGKLAAMKHGITSMLCRIILRFMRA